MDTNFLSEKLKGIYCVRVLGVEGRIFNWSCDVELAYVDWILLSQVGLLVICCEY